MLTAAKHNAPLLSPPVLNSVVKILLILIAHLPYLHASPLHFQSFGIHAQEEEPLPAQDATLWIYLAVAAALVLLGGAFAGLTIALMGQVSYTAVVRILG